MDDQSSEVIINPQPGHAVPRASVQYRLTESNTTDGQTDETQEHGKTASPDPHTHSTILYAGSGVNGGCH